ncbi:DUF805 domain-containing protein [Vibrio porteresiae]|uniref:DUF805 domain-containing protein n=1 Tax=Vibrio porteresiae DSM 19223 TaxID=1123496 RepID=A0ABZ0QLK9_9VIBR|nr:DUF805 domain-containing protein [Vibrio porteresiae]WPC76370.1 DUF805 domain-containing protein [Vibrio porteresiae DSM 19223]
MNAYWQAWQRYGDFAGASTRKECWLFMFWHLVVSLLCIWLDIVWTHGDCADIGYSLLSFIPMLAVMVRRLHDSGRSGHWLWVFLLPMIGPIWVIILLVLPAAQNNITKQMLAKEGE